MPADIPTAPERVYKDEWQGYGDFLGTGNVQNKKRQFKSFEEARKFVRGLGLKGFIEWNEYCRSGEKPDDIPRGPDKVYKDKWINYGDFLGTGNLRNSDRVFRPFEEAREFVRRLGLKNQREWNQYCQSGQRPADIPVSPHDIYETQWRGYGDWLGVVTKWTPIALLALLEDLRPRLPYLKEEELYAILQQGGAMPALRRKLGVSSPGAILKDLKENAGRDTEAALMKSSDEEDEEDPAAPAQPGDEPLAVADGVPGEDAHAFEDDPLADFASEGLPTIATPEAIRMVDELASLPYGLDAEVAEYLVANRVAALWTLYINEEEDEDAVATTLSGEGGHYFELIRSRFYSELAGVEALEVPKEWAFGVEGVPTPPNTMQLRTAWEVLTKKRVGNWSGVGSGKTLSAVLASRVVGARSTLIVANNSTIRGWCEQISDAFDDSVVRTRASEPLPGRFNYAVLNYEKFQQPNTGTLVRRLLEEGCIDFVVFDEVQLVKQRDCNASKRRKALEGLVYALAERNSELRVLGMSATPVINNLMEARKLLEVISGRSHAELNTQATVNNALAVHRALMIRGFRYRPRYEIKMEPPPPVEVVRNDLLDDLLGADGVLGLEQTLLGPKLEAITPYVRRGTLIYTHYVDGMVTPIRAHFEDLGMSVGLYTGSDKSGLDTFLGGELDVLIGSKPIGTGLDGLQRVCDNLVFLSLPWTGAEYEQIVGRVHRQGSAFGKVRVVVPEVLLEHATAGVWSWDRGRMATIRYKRTLSDCAVDGRIPEAVRISETELLRRSREALEKWIARVGEDGLLFVERSKLTVPLPKDVREKLVVRRGDFTTINNRWNTSNSETVHERLKTDPAEWYLYHTLYREHRKNWPEVPAEHIATHLKGRPDLRVGDFGCGECLLREALGSGHEVVGLDHVAHDATVLACDMAHAPLEDSSLGAAVFSLSLMGRNWRTYIDEAHRTLQPFGLLFVAEPTRRWEEGKLEAAIEEVGFGLLHSYRRGDFLYVQGVKRGL